jgi:hypothetical protein
MFRPIAFVAILWGLISYGCTSAHSEVCPDATVGNQTLEAPPGTGVSLTFFRAHPVPSYIEVCLISDDKKVLVFSAVTERNNWYRAIDISASNKRFSLKVYSAKLRDYSEIPWVVITNTRTNWGRSFEWFDEIEASYRNTTLDVCLRNKNVICPKHPGLRQARNIAEMSEYGRSRWIQSWMRRHAGATITP